MNHFHALLSQRKIARALAGGAVALAAGGIVLLRAPQHGSAAPTTQSGPHSTATVTHAAPGQAPRAEFRGPWAHGRFALAQAGVAADGTRQVFAELRVAADDRAMPAGSTRPVAMALVLDVSGSMSGEKLAQAKQSVLEVVDRMRDDDRISLVTYSDSARVVQPLARVGDVRAQMHVTVPTIAVEGGTNIPSGLSMGAQTLVEAPSTLVRRVVLMSDGRDGSNRDLETIAQEVRTRADQGVMLSSLGVGADYDERYMARLADAGRGNYEFMRDGTQMRAFLARELQQATRTTVERAVAEVTLPAGWRLTRAYGCEATVSGQTVRLPVGALFAGDERRLVLDLAVDAPAAGASTAGALAAHVAWHVVPEGRDASVDTGALALAVVATEAEAAASRDAAVFGEAESTVIAARQFDAVGAWRDGRVAEAQAISQRNLEALQRIQAAAPSPARAAQITAFQSDSTNFANVAPASEAGRAYGLGSNARHRAALRSSSAY
jgi:Ca-activated chloride channel family protein